MEPIKNKLSCLSSINSIFINMLLIGLLFTGCSTGKNNKMVDADKDVYYTCSMHPQVHEDKAGNCPICGMKLIRVEVNPDQHNYQHNGQEKAHDKDYDKDITSLDRDTDLSALMEPVTQTVVGSFKTITVVQQHAEDTVTVYGQIGFDQRDLNTVSSRVAGRIDRLYVKYGGQPVQKGKPLMEIYSPQLLSVQRDLLQAVRDNDLPIISALKERLVNLGMEKAEIQRVINSKHPISEITIFSPYQGISRQIHEPSESMRSGGMINGSGNGFSNGFGNGLLDISQGRYVEEGQTVFVIQNLSRRWGLLHVFAENIDQIHLGDPVEVYTDAQMHNKNHISGQVDFIPPYRDSMDKSTTVRVYLSNIPDDWKIGTLIHAKVATGRTSSSSSSSNNNNNSVFLPLSAVNRLGIKSVVWVKDKKQSDVFHARLVQTGIRRMDSIEILSGIHPGDQIIENAAYLVDSDSFIQ